MDKIKSPTYKHRPKYKRKKYWDPYNGKYVRKSRRASCYKNKKWKECSKDIVNKYINDENEFEIRNIDDSIFKLPKQPYKKKISKTKKKSNRVCAIKYNKKTKKKVSKTYKNKKSAKKIMH